MASSAYIPAPVVLTGLPVGPLNGSYRMQFDGAAYYFQIKNADTGFFHTIFVRNGVLAIGPADETATQVDDGSFDPAGSNPANGAYRVKTDVSGSYLQLKAADTDLFHTLFVRGGALAIGGGEA